MKVGDVVSIDDGKLRGTIVGQEDGGFAVNVTEGRNKGVKIKPGADSIFRPSTSISIR